MDLAPRAASRLSRSQRIAMLGGVTDRAVPLRLQRADLLAKLMRLDEAWAELAGLDDGASLLLRCQILTLRGDPASAAAAADLLAGHVPDLPDGPERDLLLLRQLDLLVTAGSTAALDDMWRLATQTPAPAAQVLVSAISLLLRHGLTAQGAGALLHDHRQFLLAPTAPPRSHALHNALLAISGDMPAARAAAGLDRFIHHQRLLDAHDPLIAAAIAELKQGDDLHCSGERRPGRHLQRIGQLPAWGMVAVPALLQRIIAAVQTHVASLPQDQDHRFLRARPAGARLAAWAAIAGEHGHEEWHTHDKAWLSGTCYLAVPDGLPDHAGAIAFGWPGLPPVVTHRPFTGDLVLFPSCQHHRTMPLGRPGERIALTFDVMPA
jgi:hypothetical protein